MNPIGTDHHLSLIYFLFADRVHFLFAGRGDFLFVTMATNSVPWDGDGGAMCVFAFAACGVAFCSLGAAVNFVRATGRIEVWAAGVTSIALHTTRRVFRTSCLIIAHICPNLDL